MERLYVGYSLQALQQKVMAKFDHLFIEPSDFEASNRFYTETLGWTKVDGWGDEGGPKGGFYKSTIGTALVMAEHHDNQGDHAKEGGINGYRPTIHLKIEDVEEFRKSLPDNAKVVVEQEKNHWGRTWMVVEDPDGNLYAYES